MPTTPPIKPSSGTMTWQSFPTTVYYPNSRTAYRLESTTRGYVFFAGLAALVRGKNVSSAVLTFTRQTGALGAINVERHGAPRTGTAYSTISWGTQPPTLSGAAQLSGSNGVVDVTADVQAIAAGAVFYGYRFWSTAARFYVDGWQAAGAPTLTVTYSTTPLAPTGVVPNGKVSVAAPTMAWQGDPEATYVRVQVGSPGTNFATLLFDSGWTAFTGHGMDLTARGWSGLADGASGEVQVAQRTTAGDSPWSTPVTITRSVKPTITLSAPGTSTGDTTPVHTWSQSPTGETQIGFRLYLRDAVTGKQLSDSGYQTGSQTSYSPLVGAATSGQQVTSRLQVYFPDRVDSPGDPAYAFVEKTWTFNADLTKAPASSLTPTQVGQSPKVRLTFTRTDSTDEWIIYRNGVQIDRFSADERKVNATSWVYDSWLGTPNSLDTWTVAPVVNGTVGASLSQTFETRVGGVWVVDPVTGESFSVADPLGGTTDMTQSYTEGAATYTAVDGTTITHSYGMQGLAGSVAGVLIDWDGRTIADQTADAFIIKSRPSRTLRMIWTNRNIPVRLSQVNPVPATSDYLAGQGFIPYYAISFNYSQVGELPFGAP